MSFRLRTKYGTAFEPVLLSVSYDNGMTWTEPKYCGSTHCDGECGHPALVFTDITGRLLRAHGSQVACGLVFQMQRSGRQWTGKTEEVPAEIDRKLLKEMIWF